MRMRDGNPFRDQHWNSRRVLEWIAPPGTDANAVVYAVEAALPGLIADGNQNFCVNTSVNIDRSLYIAVCLYDEPCDNPIDCPGGHAGVTIGVAPDADLAQCRAMVDAAGGEDQDHVIDGRDFDDQVLADLGFLSVDAPRIPKLSREEHDQAVFDYFKPKDRRRTI